MIVNKKMKNLYAIKPYEEDNFFSDYRKRKNRKKLKTETQFPNINKTQYNDINRTKLMIKTNFYNSSITKTKSIITDKYLKNKKRYNHKDYLLSIKYLRFLSQENINDDYIDKLNTSINNISDNEDYQIEKLKIKDKLKKELRKKNFNEQLDALIELDNIPKYLLENTAKYIINKVNNKKIEKSNTERPKLIIHNVYFNWILFSIFHKIEIRDQKNGILNQDIVMNMLQHEIKKIQDNVIYYVQKNLKKNKIDESLETLYNFNQDDYETFLTLKKKYKLKNDLNLNELDNNDISNVPINKMDEIILKQLILKKSKGGIRDFNNDNYYHKYNSNINNNTNDIINKKNQNDLINEKINNNDKKNFFNINNKNNSFYPENRVNYLRKKKYYSSIPNQLYKTDNINFDSILPLNIENNNEKKKYSIDSYRNTYSNSLFETKRTTNITTRTNNFNLKNDDDERNNLSSERNQLLTFEENINKEIINENNNEEIKVKKKKKNSTLNDFINDKIDFEKNEKTKRKKSKKKNRKKVNENILENNEQSNENNISNIMGDKKEMKYIQNSEDITDEEFHNFVQRESLKFENENDNDNNNINTNLNVLKSNQISKKTSSKLSKKKKSKKSNLYILNDKLIKDDNKTFINNDLINENKELNDNININNNNNIKEEYNQNIKSPNEDLNNLNYSSKKSKNLNNKKETNSLTNLSSKQSSSKKLRKYSSVKIRKENININNSEEEENEISSSNIISEESDKEEEKKLKMEKINALKIKQMEEYLKQNQKKNLIIQNSYSKYSKNTKINTLEQNKFLRTIYLKNILNNSNNKEKNFLILEEEKLNYLPEEEILKENERILKIAMGNENMRKLIYDNSYLFKNKDEKINLELKERVREIIEGNYEIKEKEVEKKKTYSPKKKKKLPKKYIFEKNGLKMVLNYDLNQSLNEEETMKKNLEQKKLEEENHYDGINHEIRLKQFFEKIKKLKEDDFGYYNNELDLFIEDQINSSEMGKVRLKENRLKEFSLTLNDFRLENSKNRQLKLNNLIFKSPCEFETLKKKKK